MTEFPKATRSGAIQPGEWWPFADGARLSASICCPQCKQRSYLDHEIAADGTVSPSIECPTDGCSFHVNGRLLGWSP